LQVCKKCLCMVTWCIAATTDSISDSCLRSPRDATVREQDVAEWRGPAARIPRWRERIREHSDVRVPRLSDATSWKRQDPLIMLGASWFSGSRCTHRALTLASFNRTKLHVITHERALKRLRLKGIQRSVRCAYACIYIYTHTCILCAREEANERTTEHIITRVCENSRDIGERAADVQIQLILIKTARELPRETKRGRHI